MVKWEYKKYFLNLWVDASPLEEQLNVFGQDGWEVIGFTVDKYNVPCCFIFKRPILENDFQDDKDYGENTGC